MNNNKSNLKEPPKGLKFASINSHDYEDIILEKIIAKLIYNGYSFNEVCKSLFDNEKESEYMGPIITDLTLAFINLNPAFAIILERNNKPNEF